MLSESKDEEDSKERRTEKGRKAKISKENIPDNDLQIVHANNPKVKRKRDRLSSGEDDEQDADWDNEKRGRKTQRGRKKAKLHADEGAGNSPPTSAGPLTVNLYELGFEEAEVDAKKAMADKMKRKSAMPARDEQNYKKIDLKRKSYSKGKGAGKYMMKMEYKRKLSIKVC